MRKILFLIIMLISGLMLQAEESAMKIQAGQLAKLCAEADFGFQNQSNIKDVWELILYVAKTQPNEAPTWVPVMAEALRRTHSELEKAKHSANKAGTPTTNVSVEGIPVSGMDPNQVKDLTLRRKYEAAIAANKMIIDKHNAYNKLRVTYEGMLADTAVVIDNFEKDYPQIKRELQQNYIPNILMN